MKIIQIGANKGNTDNDPVWRLCQNNLPESLKWKLYFVEPNPKAVEILEQSYKNFRFVDILPYAVTDTLIMKDVQLYIDNNNLHIHAGSQHCSLYREHLKKLGHKDEVISSIRVLSFNLNDIFILFGIQNEVIDYLQIDTEGYDGKILLGADLNRCKINKIEFEHEHLQEEEFKLVVQKLIDNNYCLIWKNLHDICFELMNK